MPKASTAGDLLVVAVRDRSAGSQLATVASVTDSASEKWVRATSVAQQATNDAEIWYAVNAASVTKVTVTLTSSAALAFTILDIAGATAAVPLDLTAVSSGTSKAPSIGPTATTHHPDELVVADIGWNSSTAPSAQTAGYTTTLPEQSSVPNEAAGEQAAWRLLNATAPSTYAATLKSSVAWTGIIATFDVVGPSPTPVPTPTPTAAVGSVTGTVTDSLTKAPIAGAAVSYSGGTTTSGTTGTYSLIGIAPGTYTVTAAAVGHVTGTASVKVTAGTTATKNFVIVATTGVITGTVVDTQTPAHPVIGASVSCDGVTAITVAGGAYTLNGLSPGTYAVIATASGYTAHTDASVTVTAGKSTSATFALHATSGITGLVLDSQYPARPVAGVTVTYSGTNGAGTATSSLQGTYTLAGVPAGRYNVTASASGFAPTTVPVTVTTGVTTTGLTLTVAATSGITGNVFDSEQPPEPVTAATVAYSGPNGSGNTNVINVTTGAYTLSGVPAGTYTVTATASGYSTVHRVVTVSAGAMHSGQDFVLIAGGVISGTVFDSQNPPEPVVGASVTYTGTPGGQGTAISGPGGAYSVAGVPPGTYTVAASASNFATGTDYPVTVGQDGTASASFNLVAGSGISGTVSDSESPSHPIADATIMYTSTNGSGTAFSGVDGTYTFVGVPAGQYSVTASAPDFFSFTDTMTVSAGATASASFNLVGNSVISGVVTDSVTGASIPGAQVTYSGSIDSGSVATISDGSYAITGIQADSYTIIVSAVGYATQINSTVSVGPGSTAPLSFLLVPTAGTITGTVMDTETPAEPIANASVSYTSSAGTVSTSTGADGTYSFTGVDVGTYAVTASAPGFPAQSNPSVIVAADSTVTASFTLTASSGISGTVIDTEKPAQGVSGATVSYAGTGTTTGSGTTATGMNGVYALTGVPAGTYTVSVMDTGFNAPTRRSVTVSVSATTPNVNFTLTANSEILGTVTDSQTPPQPLNGVTVAYAGTGGTTGAGTTKTAAAGTFTFAAVPPGTYAVTATLPGYAPSGAVSVQITANTAANALVALTAGSGINGTVIDANSQPIPGVTVTYTGTVGDVARGTYTTAASGTYTFQGLSPGTYSVSASACGYTSPAPESVVVGVSATPTAPPISLTAIATTTLCGTVTDSQTLQPVFDASVTYTGGSGNVSNPTTTDMNGDYTFVGIAPGTYTVSAGAAGYGSPSQTVTVGSGPTVAPHLVLLNESRRDAFTQPFTSTSIWNMPIGSGAQYAPANLTPWTRVVSDEHVILMTPTAPLTPLDYGPGGQSGNRCVDSGMALGSIPVDAAFTLPSSSSNYPLVGIAADGHTLIQSEPFARCVAGGAAVVNRPIVGGDLYGDGQLGGDGGSGLSALGGTLRLNELVPGGVINHALQIDLDGAVNLYPGTASTCYRWPATKCDGNGPTGEYGGTNPQLVMGALLALPPTLNLDSLGLQTEPGMILATALQDYGAYVGNDSTRPVDSIVTEVGAGGSVAGYQPDTSAADFVPGQFQADWGYPFVTPATTDPGYQADLPWTEDVATIFAHLEIVTNNGPTSVGGGGVPIVSPAPPLG
jgi:hypothetical protein